MDVTTIDHNITWCNSQLGYSTFQAVLRLVGNVPLIMIGVVFNVVNLLVFSQRRMRKSVVNWFLLTLAACDLLLLVSVWFVLAQPVLVENWPTLMPIVGWANAASRWAFPIGHAAHTAVVSLTVALNLFRYLGICHPFRSLSMVTGCRARGCIFGCLLFSALFTLPRWFEVTTSTCILKTAQQSHTTMFTALVPVQTGFGSSHHYVVYYKVVTYTVFIFILPFVVLVWSNQRIYSALKRSRQTAAHRQRSVNETSTLLSQNWLTRQRIDQQLPPVRRCHSMLTVRPTLVVHYQTQLISISGLDETNMQLRQGSSVSTCEQSNNRKLGIGSAISELVSIAEVSTTSRNTPHLFAAERDADIGRMLAAVAALFLVCNALPLVNNCLEIALRLQNLPVLPFLTAHFYTALVELGSTLLTLNSAVSLPIYWRYSSRFRDQSRLLFDRWWCVERRSETTRRTTVAVSGAQSVVTAPVVFRQAQRVQDTEV